MGEPALTLCNPDADSAARTAPANPLAAGATSRALDLALIPAVLRPQAEEAFRAGDAGGMVCLMDNTVGLAFVFDNVWALLERGIFEEALVHAYTLTRVNFSRWSTSALRFLFDRADRAKLRAAGDPMPAGDRFALYRGVAGAKGRRRMHGMSAAPGFSLCLCGAKGRRRMHGMSAAPGFSLCLCGAKGRRRMHGMSWTRDLDGAAWLACRFMLPDPAVYETTATPTDVYFYSRQRAEDDFVLWAGSVRRRRMTPDELKARAERRADAMRAANEKFHEPASKIIDPSVTQSAPQGGKAI